MAKITAFSDQISAMAKGTLDVELTSSLAQLVQQVRDTGKKGSLSLTIVLAPMSRSDDIIKWTPEIKLSLPKLAQPSSVFWSTADGDLLRNDPTQQELEFTKIEDQKPSKIIQIGER